jgi:hypothetical protein
MIGINQFSLPSAHPRVAQPDHWTTHLEAPMSIRKHGLIWAVVGLGVPIFWGALSFILFNAPNSWWTDMYWNLVYITCLSRLLPEYSASWVITPILNAVLYGAVAMAAVSISRTLRHRSRIDK